MTLRLVTDIHASTPTHSVGIETRAARSWQPPSRDDLAYRARVSRSETAVGVATATLLATALLLGGGTHNNLFTDLVVQFLAAILLIYGLARLSWQDLRPAARQYLLLVAMVSLLPVLQLLPLPASLVSEFAGRNTLWTTYAALGMDVPAFVPWSLDPNATLAALRGLLPASALAVLGVQLGTPWLKRLSLIFVAIAVIMVPIGIGQVAQGPQSALRPYVPTNLHDAVGLFANRNHYAALLTAALVAIFGGMLLTARPRQKGSANVLRMVGWMLLGAILLLGIVLSRSRAAVGLAGMVSIVMLVLAFVRRREQPQVFRWFLGFVTAAGLLAFQFGFLAIADRLSQRDDQRWSVSADVLAVARDYSWLGTGIGSFPAVYAAHEPIELVSDKILNHAHNDWAELLVEIGAPLVPAALLFALWLLARARELMAVGSLAQSGQSLRLVGIGVLLTLAAHSVVDYPLRTTALSVVFALAGAFACCPVDPSASRASREGARG